MRFGFGLLKMMPGLREPGGLAVLVDPLFSVTAFGAARAVFRELGFFAEDRDVRLDYRVDFVVIFLGT
jgi:hypothetical protein